MLAHRLEEAGQCKIPITLANTGKRCENKPRAVSLRMLIQPVYRIVIEDECLFLVILFSANKYKQCALKLMRIISRRPRFLLLLYYNWGIVTIICHHSTNVSRYPDLDNFSYSYFVQSSNTKRLQTTTLFIHLIAYRKHCNYFITNIYLAQLRQ